MKTFGWWQISTDNPSSEQGDQINLGIYQGEIDDIALRLAHLQRGFWCDGKLTFKPTKEPRLPKKMHDKVNICLDFSGLSDGTAEQEVAKAKRFLKGRPVHILECNLYATITLVKKK